MSNHRAASWLLPASLLLLRASIAAAGTLTGSASGPTTRQAPDEFGTTAYAVTTVPAAAFTFQNNNGYIYGSCACTSFQCSCFTGTPPFDFYAGVNLPAGAVIDYIGVESTSPQDFQAGFALHVNHRDGTDTIVSNFACPAHGWDTDYNQTPLGYQLAANVHNALVLHVQLGSSQALFAWVEVWWHRTVSDPPVVATFGDVPVNHPFYRFIEAIAAAGITAGCGSGNFCPDQPISRKQEAAFIAKALGLHWPN